MNIGGFCIVPWLKIKQVEVVKGKVKKGGFVKKRAVRLDQFVKVRSGKNAFGARGSFSKGVDLTVKPPHVPLSRVAFVNPDRTEFRALNLVAEDSSGRSSSVSLDLPFSTSLDLSSSTSPSTSSSTSLSTSSSTSLGLSSSGLSSSTSSSTSLSASLNVSASTFPSTSSSVSLGSPLAPSDVALSSSSSPVSLVTKREVLTHSAKVRSYVKPVPKPRTAKDFKLLKKLRRAATSQALNEGYRLGKLWEATRAGRRPRVAVTESTSYIVPSGFAVSSPAALSSYASLSSLSSKVSENASLTGNALLKKVSMHQLPLKSTLSTLSSKKVGLANTLLRERVNISKPALELVSSRRAGAIVRAPAPISTHRAEGSALRTIVAHARQRAAGKNRVEALAQERFEVLIRAPQNKTRKKLDELYKTAEANRANRR